MIDHSLPLPLHSQHRQASSSRATVAPSPGAPAFLDHVRSGSSAAQSDDASSAEDARDRARTAAARLSTASPALDAQPQCQPQAQPAPDASDAIAPIDLPSQAIDATTQAPVNTVATPTPAPQSTPTVQAAMQSSAASSTAKDLLLEFHLHGAGGEREVVVTPWRLIASGHLAQRIDGVATLDTASTPARTNTATGWTTSVANEDGTALPTLSAGLMQAGPGAAASVAATQSAERSVGGGAIEHTRRASSPAASEWLARWMKWFERDGHDRTVWLRDFRLDDDQTGRVVDDLRTLAREQGLSLDRIVVNGRERWRNPHSQQPSGQRE